jgi:undecaprenyl diphosphate synthase
VIPKHVAVIMDGNRRWAKANGLPVAEGYKRGVAALREAVRGAINQGVERLTVYGFSTENWQRDTSEIDIIMQLCASAARGEMNSLVQQGVRVETIGDIDAFALPARAAVRALVRATARNHRLTLTLALNYSGRSEIVTAVQALASDVVAGRLRPEDITEETLRARMYAPHAADPDLLIRTGGDHRISNFLLYQVAYTELLTLPQPWPEFTAETFAEAVQIFAQRQRRYGL